MPFRQFGGRVTDSLKNRYQQSPNWSDGKFQNLQDTSMSISLKDFPKILYQQLSGRSDRTPNKPLPIRSFDHQKLMDSSEKMKYAWYGHSADARLFELLNHPSRQQMFIREEITDLSHSSGWNACSLQHF